MHEGAIEHAPVTLSLVTGTMDRHLSLHRLIDSIKRHTVVDWELIIGDAGELPLYISDPRITRIVERPRLGHTKGYNNCFALCRGKWVIWLNDDAEVLPGYDTSAISFMRDNPNCGMGALHYNELLPNNTWLGFKTHCYRSLPFANFGILLNSYGRSLGWFDERFHMYGADNSLAFKVFLSGRVVLPIPGEHILHYSPKDAQREDNQQWRVQSRELFRDYDALLPSMYQVYKNHTGIDLMARRVKTNPARRPTQRIHRNEHEVEG